MSRSVVGAHLLPALPPSPEAKSRVLFLFRVFRALLGKITCSGSADCNQRITRPEVTFHLRGSHFPPLGSQCTPSEKPRQTLRELVSTTRKSLPNASEVTSTPPEGGFHPREVTFSSSEVTSHVSEVTFHPPEVGARPPEPRCAPSEVTFRFTEGGAR
jgi:hypothetical protein